MNMDIYDLMYGLNEVSDYLVMETQKKSPQLRERGIIKWATMAACVCLVAAAALYSVYMRGGFGNIFPTGTVGETTDTDDISGVDAGTEETDDAVVKDADGSALMVSAAFEKLSEASYYESEMTLYTLAQSGTSAAGQDRILKFTHLRDPKGAFLLDLTYTDAYDTAYAEGTSYQLYSAGGGDYFTMTAEKGGDESLTHGYANSDFSTDTLMNILAADNKIRPMFDVSPVSYGQLKSFIAGAQNGEINDYDGGVRIAFSLDREEIIDLIGLENYDTAEGAAVFTFFISDAGYPESVSLNLELTTDDSTYALTLECSYANINQKSSVTEPKWINEAKEQIGDFTVFEGELLAYTGTETELVIPAGITKIGRRAFADSPAAGSITKITLGRDVSEINTDAFFGLPSLRRVDVDADNTAFHVGTYMYKNDAFLCGLNEQIIFYFPEGDSKAVDIDGMQIPSSYREKTDVAFVCGNAVFDIYYEDYETDYYNWFCRSVRYDGNQVSFEAPVDLTGNYELIIFETDSRELVFETTAYNFADIYYVTKDTSAAAELHNLPGYSVSFYLGEDSELRYRKIGEKYVDLEQTAAYIAAYYIITDRDQYYGEDGRVLFENGEFEFLTENVYTISDYFEMKGTDIDTWFLSLNDNEDLAGFYNPFDSLEELMEKNRKNAGD